MSAISKTKTTIIAAGDVRRTILYARVSPSKAYISAVQRIVMSTLLLVTAGCNSGPGIEGPIIVLDAQWANSMTSAAAKGLRVVDPPDPNAAGASDVANQQGDTLVYPRPLVLSRSFRPSMIIGTDGRIWTRGRAFRPGSIMLKSLDEDTMVLQFVKPAGTTP